MGSAVDGAAPMPPESRGAKLCQLAVAASRPPQSSRRHLLQTLQEQPSVGPHSGRYPLLCLMLQATYGGQWEPFAFKRRFIVTNPTDARSFAFWGIEYQDTALVLPSTNRC